MKKFKSLFLVMVSVFLVTGCTINFGEKDCPKCAECTKCEENCQNDVVSSDIYKSMFEKDGVEYINHYEKKVVLNGESHVLTAIYAKDIFYSSRILIDGLPQDNFRFYLYLFLDNTFIESYTSYVHCSADDTPDCYLTMDLSSNPFDNLYTTAVFRDSNRDEEYLYLYSDKYEGFLCGNHTFYVINKEGNILYTYNKIFYLDGIRMSEQSSDKYDLFSYDSKSITFPNGKFTRNDDLSMSIGFTTLTVKNGVVFDEASFKNGYSYEGCM